MSGEGGLGSVRPRQWCQRGAADARAQSRAGRAGAGVGASEPAPARQAEEGDVSLARNWVPLLKRRKRGVSEALKIPVCFFSRARDVRAL